MSACESACEAGTCDFADADNGSSTGFGAGELAGACCGCVGGGGLGRCC